ncbi:thymidylate synthase [Bradyrhizobium sp. ARR65]|uniref:thymidylate synthase n=1 Tax=Bradyrhizobium sp. ARR65 TaxID=1040989 RepID=UPI000467EA56|nr:thymidylate synthase [Bradyrhizobium sp. ARR65]
MHLAAETLDDVLLKLYPQLLAAPLASGATRGANREILGTSIQITKPRARLSRTETRGRPFSALGELLWYLSKDNQLAFIEPFIPAYRKESEDGVTVYGGYGPRLFKQRGHDQIANVLAKLRERPATRKAVVQLFNAEDLSEPHDEIPCTTTLQFLLRKSKLEMIVTMRSNDAYKGLPHDVFCFTMLQEILARTLGCEMASYRHFVGSMHLYEDADGDRNDRTAAMRFVEEGYQSQVEMPAMPRGDPWSSIEQVLAALEKIRAQELIRATDLGLDPYWGDLIRMLQIFVAKDERTIRTLQQEMSSACYKDYINNRAYRSRKKGRSGPNGVSR